MRRFIVPLAAALLLSHTALAADDPKLIGAFGGWNAYAFTDKGQKVCFMSAKPAKQEGKFKKRGNVLLFVTHWPEDKLKNVVTVSAGYPYSPGSEAALTVNGDSYKLTTAGETASSKDETSDDAITAAIAKGGSLKVEGVSARGTETADTYDLSGAADAWGAIGKECDTKEGAHKS
jgi:hypothetical protein